MHCNYSWYNHKARIVQLNHPHLHVGWESTSCLESWINSYNGIIGSQKFLHNTLYDKLLSSYNVITNTAIWGCTYPEVEYFQCVGISNNVADDFDCISSADFSDAMGYLNIHSQAAYRKKKASGSHDDFATFVRNCPYCLYHHLCLWQVSCLQNIAVPTLSASVIRDSLLPCPQWSTLSSGVKLVKQH